MSFWKTKLGKILNHGIHEHNSGIGLIKANIKFLKDDYVREKKHFSKEDHERMLKTIHTSLQKCKDSMDYIYTEIKKYEEEWKK